jgi:cell division protein FtsL
MRRVILIGTVVAGLLLLDTQQRIHMITLGYEIEQLKKTERDFHQANKELLIEQEALSSLDRIERIAIQDLKMVRPDTGQIVHVDTRPKQEKSPVDEDQDTIEVVRN